MKRFLCFAASVTIAMGAVAGTQPADTAQNRKTATAKPVELGVKAGIGSSLITGLPGDKDGGLSYRIGATLDWYINRTISINPELRVNHCSTTVRGYYGSEQIDKAKFPLSLDYLELPVHAAFNIPIGGKCRLLFKTGPYVAYGLMGKTSVEMQNSDFKQKMPGSLFSYGCDYGGIAYSSNKKSYALPKFKRWDYGVSYSMGLEYGHVVVTLDTTIGLAYLTGTRVSNHLQDLLESIVTLSRKPRRMDFALSVGYKL